MLHAPDADPESYEVRMATVGAVAIRERIAGLEAGEPVDRPVELQGLRLGPIALLGAPLEIFQAIKNDVVARAAGPVTLVTSFANDSIGYAPDQAAAERGGYAADMVPFIAGTLPYANAHEELVEALLRVDAELA